MLSNVHFWLKESFSPCFVKIGPVYATSYLICLLHFLCSPESRCQLLRCPLVSYAVTLRCDLLRSGYLNSLRGACAFGNPSPPWNVSSLWPGLIPVSLFCIISMTKAEAEQPEVLLAAVVRELRSFGTAWTTASCALGRRCRFEKLWLLAQSSLWPLSSSAFSLACLCQIYFFIACMFFSPYLVKNSTDFCLECLMTIVSIY